jgi:RimJ/RimL family protein N-acetyltransferase
MAEFRIETDRLILREWRTDDFDGLHQMSQDAEIMAFLGPLYSPDETVSFISRSQTTFAENGHCFWAVEQAEDGQFVGSCGLKPGPENTPLAGKMEIGWRLARNAWGKGYAHEAALASLKWGFANLAADSIWAITVPANTRSWGLMERLGMVRHPDLDFDHPNVPEGSPLKRHITYCISRDAWTKA